MRLLKVCPLALGPVVFAFFIIAPTATPQLGGGAAGTALMSMWDQVKLQPLIREPAGQANKAAPQIEHRQWKSSATPWKLGDQTDPGFRTSARLKVSAYAVDCPSDWKATVGTPKQPSGILFSPKSEADEREFSTEYDPVPANKSLDSDGYVKFTLAYWANQVGFSLPKVVELEDVSTILGPGIVTGFQIGFEGKLLATHFLFVKRPHGFFIIMADNPVGADATITPVLENVISSVNFRIDQSQGEHVRAAQRNWND